MENGKVRPGCIDTVFDNRLISFSARPSECKILRGEVVMGGNRNRDIANCLFTSEETVKPHIKHPIEKLDAMDRTHAVRLLASVG